jgi:RNA polymerase sigma-70 factor (ECF subfamily)
MTDFGSLLEEQIPRLRRYAMALTRDSAHADDLVQNCLLRALEKSHLWEPGTNLRAWLFTILHNQHVNVVRAAARAGTQIPIDDVAATLWVAPTQETAPHLIDLDRAIGRLPAEQRGAVLLVGLEGMGYEEAATIMNVPVGTIRSRLWRGRAMLRQLMDDQAPLPAAAAAAAPARAQRGSPAQWAQ